MWSDSLLAAEREHLQRLVLWAIASVLVGTALLAWLAIRRERAPLLSHFAIQSVAWGAIDLAIAGWAWRGLKMRDLDGATALDRFLWLNVGLDVGYVGVGVTLAVTGWMLGRRLGLVGAGIGVVVQGLALLVLDAVFINTLRRLVHHG